MNNSRGCTVSTWVSLCRTGALGLEQTDTILQSGSAFDSVDMFVPVQDSQGHVMSV